MPTPRLRPKWLENLRLRPKLTNLLLKRPLLNPRRKPKLLRLKLPVKWPPLKSKLRNSKLNSEESKPPRRLDKKHP